MEFLLSKAEPKLVFRFTWILNLEQSGHRRYERYEQGKPNEDQVEVMNRLSSCSGGTVGGNGEEG